MMPLDRITDAVLERGDLAHLALFVWASGASGFALLLLRALSAANSALTCSCVSSRCSTGAMGRADRALVPAIHNRAQPAPAREPMPNNQEAQAAQARQSAPSTRDPEAVIRTFVRTLERLGAERAAKGTPLEREVKFLAEHVASVGETGVFEGYASLFGVA